MGPKIRKLLSSSKLKGVNFCDYGFSVYQNACTRLPPSNYIEDSFDLFAKNRITCVRVPFYWESWELDSNQFQHDLNLIANSADKYGIMCIYDNHQWECSSWIGYGIGMPNSIMSKYYERRSADSEPNFDIKKDFWNRWWKRELSTTGGVDGWYAQLDYLERVVNLLKNRKYTFGFEILNEPEVFEFSHYKKVGKYHDFMINGLRKITIKPLLYCWALPHLRADNPLFQARTAPAIKDNNVIYDGHLYPPGYRRMLYFKSIALLMGNIPLYIGEFNSKLEEGTTLTPNEYSKYIRRFKGTCGWALWRWSHKEDCKFPAFNLTKIANNRIQLGASFNYAAEP